MCRVFHTKFKNSVKKKTVGDKKSLKIKAIQVSNNLYSKLKCCKKTKNGLYRQS